MAAPAIAMEPGKPITDLIDLQENEGAWPVFGVSPPGTITFPTESLCPNLIVQPDTGVRVLIQGNILPVPQDEHTIITKMDHLKDRVLQAIVTENAGVQDVGILLEIPFRAHIAFLDTSKAFLDPSKTGEDQPAGRHVVIERAFNQRMPFATVRENGKAGHYLVQKIEGPQREPQKLLLQIFMVTGDAANIIDPERDTLIGAMEPDPSSPKEGPKRFILHMKRGSDAGLMISALLATWKLARK